MIKVRSLSLSNFLLLLITALSLIGCKKDEVIPENDVIPVTKENHSIEVSPSTFTFPASGGRQPIEVTATKSIATILEEDTLEYRMEQVHYTITISGEGFSLEDHEIVATPHTGDQRSGSLFVSIDNTSLIRIINLTQKGSAEHEEPKEKHTFLLSGASFATPNNGWFELACKKLGVTAINRAQSGTAIADMANSMAEESLYSKKQLEEISALVIMHAVNRDVFNEVGLFESYRDYSIPFDRSNYAAAFDYVIKRYRDDCFQLKFDKGSKYYNEESGKPAVIILCTDWHDARAIYNASVRKLADKWDFSLVEFDSNIGFSRNEKDPISGAHMSTLYSPDRQTINGEEHGWHPHRGTDQEIQQRMGTIFMNKVQEVFPGLVQ